MASDLPRIDQGQDMPRSKAEWIARFGAPIINGRVELREPPYVFLALQEVELLDGKIVGATSVEGKRYAALTLDGKILLMSDDDGNRNWPYPEGLE